MWNENDSSVAVVSSVSACGNGSASGNGFYVGRGRGFGNMSQMGNSLPQVGAQFNGGGNDKWNVDDTNSQSGWGNTNKDSSNSKAVSGWNDDDGGWNESESTPSQSKTDSGWNDNAWDESESAPAQKSSWNTNSRDTSRFNDSRPPRKSSSSNHYLKTSRLNDYSNKSRLAKGSKCFKCQEEGHMSRECPNGDANSGGGGGRSCFSCGDPGHLSKDCPSKSGGGGGRNCFRCNKPGHISKDCPNEDTRGGGGGKNCFRCNEPGHMSKDCPNESRGGGRDLTCYKCNGKGHMSKDCTNGSGSNSKGCFNCNEEGHMSRDCPNEKKSSKGSGCFKCHQDGHMAKDCTNEAVGEDGKVRPPPYIPPEPSEDADSLFMGVPTGINFSKYDDIHVDVSGSNAPRPIDSFENSGLCSLLLKNIKNSKYSKPTPVQKYSIPIIKGKRDLMACAQTGSGKTAAFLLPILDAMIPNSELPNNADQDVQEPWAVIVAPTRELVIQIGSEARKFAYDSVVKADVVYGGTSTSYQSSRLKRGCHILVATPGRLMDFLNKGKISFSQLRYLVLDEADRMLDMGFAPAIKDMVSHESMPGKGERQTLMFSATFPDSIQEMAKEFLDNYLFLTVGMIGAANTDVTQTFFNVGQFDKRQQLLDILKEAGTDRTLVFVEQKRTADFIASLCSQNSIPTTSIHGDRLQREREEALRDFRTGKMPVLVATAVAARGLDIRDVCHVINYDLPKSIDEYVHRIGRTGRVGNLGKATSFYDSSADQELARSLKKILIDAQQPIPDWLSEEANSATGTTVQYGGRGNFGSRDVRNQGRGRNSNDAFDNFDNSGSNSYKSSAQTFAEPVADDEDWG